MKQQDWGTADATGLIECAGMPGDSYGPTPANSKVTGRIAASATIPAFLRIRATLGIAERDDSKESNWQTLALREFRCYFAGSVVSNFGTWLQNTAQVVLAYQLTHSVFWVGMVTFAQFSSPLVLGPWAGVLTHRFGYWRTLIATQIASMLVALALAVLQFSNELTIRWLLACAEAIGLAFTFALPALSLAVAALVPKTEIKRALAMDSVSYNLGRALAPVLSVLIFATIGPGWAFALNAASYSFFVAVLLVLKPRHAQEQTRRSRVINGFRLVRQDQRILILLLMVAAVTFADDPILVLGPAMARSFGTPASWSGIFIAALGIGSVTASFGRTRQALSLRRAAMMLGILSLSMMLFVTAHWLWLSVAAAFAAGMACLVAGAATRALLLHYTSPSNQAAIMAAWAVAWAGSKPIASFVDGTLAGLIGVRPTGILLALPALVPALVLVLYPAVGNGSCALWPWTWLADQRRPI